MMVPTSSCVSSRVAVVTGANKGIGYFIALQLGLSGMFTDVILGCRDLNRGRVASEELQQRIAAAAAAGNTGSATSTIHSFPLEIGNTQSQTEFCARLEHEFGPSATSVLINNAGFAYKSSDPTPFEGQTRKTLGINYFGLVEFTEQLLPLLRQGTDPRIVNVASMAGRIGQLSHNPTLQSKFTDAALTMDELNTLMDSFERDVQSGVHRRKGWSNSNYGMSKLGVIAATKVLARREGPSICINSCCPGYCNTDMTSGMGRRPPADGAKNAVLPATMNDPPTGEHFADYKLASW